MNQNNMYANILILVQVCLFYLIISSKNSSASDYMYEACLLPRNCGQGPNISFPFYLPNLQESYCGYPGFNLSCIERFPVLRLSENDYIVQDIFYHNRSIQVYNAVLFNNTGLCAIPRIRNVTIDSTRFDYVDEAGLHLFSNCTSSLNERYNSINCNETVGNDWSVALYEGDDELASAMENCERNVVALVEWSERNRRNVRLGEALEVLRRGFLMRWIASDCYMCERSGGRCGFNESVYQFRCFCTDRPHDRICTINSELVLTSFECDDLLLVY